MAVTEYITLPQLQHALRKQGTVQADDELLALHIRAACRGIDDHTGRRFWRDDAPSARTFRPLNASVWDADGHLLLVDDIATTDGLVVEQGSTSGGWSSVTGYEVAPDNAVARSRAITGLRVQAGWPCYAGARVRVTAVWGWPAVPDVVEQAALLQATRLSKRKDSPEGVIGSAEWGGMRLAQLDPDVKALLKNYELPGFG
ncbi:phage gp6-like head-tail connector protein [Saccharothrix lopnurensis]|uniref:Phage gp6-like head-tail connector protein n=1 Tax=Saccharothrix lopnurensis TaxID=1670621 RepID=A0ABW1PIG3_9PSEU